MFFFMVVRLMPQGDPQLLELLHSLSVNVHARLCRHSRRVVPEDIAHVVEQAGHCEQQFRLTPLLLPFQDVLSIRMVNNNYQLYPQTPGVHRAQGFRENRLRELQDQKHPQDRAGGTVYF